MRLQAETTRAFPRDRLVIDRRQPKAERPQYFEHRSPLQRQRAYRALYDKKLTEEFIAAVRAATKGGWPLGSDRFKQKIALALGRRVVPLSKGRPRRTGAT